MDDPSSPNGVGTHRRLEVVVSDEQQAVAIDAERWRTLAESCLAAEGCVGEFTLTFIDRDEIAALNAEHMGVVGPTDVLSFPLDPFGDDGPGPSLIGDVVVCPEVAAAAAPEHAGTVDDELALLVVHGVLHVTGHDHAEPAEAHLMRNRERQLLEAFHWDGPAPPGFRHVHADDGDPAETVVGALVPDGGGDGVPGGGS
ncbi:MAG: rRNA maturation RNase YbeY [Ilumatobacteraceae bacterium]